MPSTPDSSVLPSISDLIPFNLTSDDPVIPCESPNEKEKVYLSGQIDRIVWAIENALEDGGEFLQDKERRRKGVEELKARVQELQGEKENLIDIPWWATIIGRATFSTSIATCIWDISTKALVW